MVLRLLNFVILVLQVKSNQVDSQKCLVSTKPPSGITLNTWSHFSDYGIIVHVDNATIQETFVQDVHKSLQTVLLLNYDREILFGRPVGYKFLNIVFLADIFQFGRFSKVLFNLEYNDVILILIRGISNDTRSHNVKMLHFWQQKGFDRAGIVFVLDLSTDNLYYECFYCGRASGVLRRTSSNEPLHSYLNNFTDFRGHYFRIGYMSYFPFFWYQQLPEVFKIAGPEGNLLKMLSETLNFRYSLENYEGYIGGEWKAMVQAVHYRKLDWAVGGISSSPERSELTDLTRHIHTETYTALFCCCSLNSTWKSWHQILMPFNLSLWLCIGGTLVIMTLLLSKAHLVQNSPANVLKYFEMTVRGLVEQPMHQIRGKEMTKRFLLIAWWYVAIIITTAYRSKLASSLIHPYYVQPNSIQDLMVEGYAFQVNNEDWSVLEENLKASLDYTYKKVLSKLNDKLDICNSIKKSVHQKIAVIDEATTLQYEAFANCRSSLNSQDFLHLRVIGEELFPSYHVWPVQLAAPYRHSFTMFIENLRSSGILSRWYNLASKEHLPMSNHYSNADSVAALTVSAMFAPILILFVGLLVAIAIFVCELIYFALRRTFIFHMVNVNSLLNN